MLPMLLSGGMVTKGVLAYGAYAALWWNSAEALLLPLHLQLIQVGSHLNLPIVVVVVGLYRGQVAIHHAHGGRERRRFV